MLDDLDDDELHPIPKVNAIDYVRTIQGGGAGYSLVIARPLEADRRSMHRLRRKIEGYVKDFFSKESNERQGTPKPHKMWIFVNIHRDSSPTAFEMLKQHEPWILENGIKLIVNTIDDNGIALEKNLPLIGSVN